MKSYLFIGLWALLLTLTSCSAQETTSTETPSTETEMVNLKEIAVKAQNAFFRDYSAEDVTAYFREDYIQHNLAVPTGIEPVLGFLPYLKEANTTYKNHRLLQDGDFIVFHNTYDNAEAFGAKEMVTFDIYRMQDGKVAEHWDAITPVVAETASGRSQFDGPTEITDLDKTEANKAMIKQFMEDVMMGAHPEKITDYISAVQYHQHNPAVKDGLEGLQEAIAYLSSQNNMFTYKQVHRILGEGNFVLTQSEGEWSGKPQAFYDLYRIEEGKIVEHWDVIQEIPPQEEWKNENGKF